MAGAAAHAAPTRPAGAAPITGTDHRHRSSGPIMRRGRNAGHQKAGNYSIVVSHKGGNHER
jgi:hypothetical protein